LKLRYLLASAAIWLAPLSLAAMPCLHYQGEPVSLSGKVILRIFFGPPNYGEDPGADSREEQAILLLRRPVCVDADQSDNDAAEKDQKEVTLVPPQGMDLRGFEGKEVDVEGNLFHANTGHHHTPVLIQVSRIQPPLEIRVGDDSYEAEGRSFSNPVALEAFLRERKATRIHVVLSSKTVSYKRGEEVMKAIQDTGGADIGLVGNVHAD
jgi:hypothetical protein